MRRVACDSITRDGSQGGLTGKKGTHDQLLSSSTLSFSPLSEAFAYPTLPLPRTQPSLTSSLSRPVAWLLHKKESEGDALHL